MVSSGPFQLSRRFGCGLKSFALVLLKAAIFAHASELPSFRKPPASMTPHFCTGLARPHVPGTWLHAYCIYLLIPASSALSAEV